MKRMKYYVMSVMAAIAIAGCEKSETDNLEMNDPEAAAQQLNSFYQVDFGELNDSGVEGEARFLLSGNTLYVNLKASGLEPNQEHKQHIHGFVDRNKNSTCPDMSADTDNDGLVELEEGLPSYGGVLLALEPFPTANANGEIRYRAEFELDVEELNQLLPLQNNSVVLHGMNAPVGSITIEAQPAPLQMAGKRLITAYSPTLPVACGQVAKTQSNGSGNQ